MEETRQYSAVSDWFLLEWLDAAGKKQADIANDLEWNKSKVSMVVRGMQRYTRDEVNELSAYLGIRPHELLMHPSEAMAYRQLRSAAEAIVTGKNQ
ncbi:helix-turn-helix transcriptional regulator [Sphingomonas rhizophila]|uniref:Helix-turn-helix transcriptional regulator n=1 Tax=Sphingomonas rhizophila TaxID=2071607 RepID=A0A7G9SB91_9SPHN|nr:helix-turn-helix transcriptional regulator [Sphingomonas rhizophila]QNN65116.1 helix-turn-helix transcriptional regulator [Sphingomonas rhizophila]